MKTRHGNGLGRGILIQRLIAATVVCASFLLGQPLANCAQMPVKTKNSIAQTLAQIPLYFVENKGQMDPTVRYFERGQGHEIFFTRAGIVFSMAGHRSPAHVSLTPQGMSEGVEVLGGVPQSAKVNVFRGKDPAEWRTNIPTYGSVIYRGAWPGVDLKFYGNNQQLEYDILVNTGGDPSKVALRYDGIQEASLTQSGDLTIGTKMGAALVQKRPVAYQEIGGKRIERQATFKIIEAPSTGKPDAPLIYGFDVAVYDPGHVLIIDPVLVFSTYLGGSKADYGIEVVADTAGNTIVAGVTQSTDFRTTANAFEPHYNGGDTDIFVAKIDKAGSKLIYSTYLGGKDIELGDVSEEDFYPFGLAVDKNGDIYVTCKTRSSDFPTTASAYSQTLNGHSDVVVAKLKATGDSLVYSTYLGGNGFEGAGGIAVDSNGNAYVSGHTSSADFPTTTGAYRRTPYGDDDIFVAKLSPKGDKLIYSTYLGGKGWDESTAIAVDQSGCVYVLSGGDSSDYPTTAGAFDRSYNGGEEDIYLTKLNATGSRLIYSTFLGGNGDDWAEGLTIDSQGNVYVAGYTESPNFPVTPGAFDTTFDASGAGNGIVCKFANVSGKLVRDYCTFLGSGDGEIGTGVEAISIDGNYNAIVTGGTSSSTFPTTSNAFSRTLRGSTDAFVAKLSSQGSKLLYSTLLGGTGAAGWEYAMGNTIDSSGIVHLTGVTNSADFPLKLAVQPQYAGGATDAFVAKISGLAALPTISIVATDLTASEPGTDKGKFTVYRTGGMRSSLVVKYSIGGTATNGTDYTKLSGSVVIPPNCYSSDIMVAPIDDTKGEDTETVVLTLVKTPSYLIGAKSSATVSINDND